MSEQLSHRDEYIALREEIMFYVRDTKRTELWALTAAGAIYAWLGAHSTQMQATWAWFLSPAILVFAAFRIIAMTTRMMDAGRYIARIEEATFSADAGLPGWEQHLQEVGHYRAFSPAWLGMIYWPTAVGLSIVFSVWLAWPH